MKKFLELTNNIKSELNELQGKLDDILAKNTILEKENAKLKDECKNALFEVEKCLIAIESIQGKNVNSSDSN